MSNKNVMAYSLSPTLSLRENIHRIAVSQTRKAIKTARKEKDFDKAIHDVRVRFKKLRALIRLVREDIGEDYYQELNTFYRDTAKLLSDIRDREANQETFRKLKADFPEAIPDSLYHDVSVWLKQEKDKLVRPDLLENVALEMEKSQEKIEQWPVSNSLLYESVEKSIKRVYKKGLKEFHVAYESDNEQAYHDFRKRIKYGWYHTLLLRKMWKSPLKVRAKELHRLSDFLGDDHDLWVLQQELHGSPFSGQKEINLLDSMISSESEFLRYNAYPLAYKLYAEKPKHYIRRLHMYWKGWVQIRQPQLKRGT
jgi:CHAD domain-containing protein